MCQEPHVKCDFVLLGSLQYLSFLLLVTKAEVLCIYDMHTEQTQARVHSTSVYHTSTIPIETSIFVDASCSGIHSTQLQVL
jgi:hypothetical protein